MKCQEVRELMSDYVEQVLADPQTDLLQQHLTVCEDCRAELVELEKTLDVLHGLPRMEPVFDLWPEFAAKMHEACEEIDGGTRGGIRRYFSRLRNSVSEGWVIFITVVRYNTNRKLGRYVSM